MPNLRHKTQSRFLRNEGWDSRVGASMVRSTDNWQEMSESRSHGHALRRLFDDITIDAVLCLEGRPTVCIKSATNLNDKDVEGIRRKLWNLGATTLLIVERQSEIQVYSTFVRPATDGSNSNAGLDDETIADLESAALALRLRQLIRRIETGAIYRSHPELFDPKGAVDQLLLSNLRSLRNLICPKLDPQGYRRAHALIGKFMFSCYLIDRGIIGDAYLQKNGLSAAKDMQQLLTGSLFSRGEVLDTLFKALQRDFNGSLFGDQDTTVSDSEVDHFRRFLSGEDLKNGQLSLFKLYDFSFVPVELISSIYQEFLAAEAEAEAKPTTRNQPRNNGQRVQGAYYTPPRLAELTIDIATEGWNTLLDKRCMDGACGSGVFLVILFVRMAEEWRRRNPGAETSQRYDALKRLLAENICGVDINLTACLVTCFSLYLAFLDQMDPKEIMELREVLEHKAQTKLLPRILWELKDESPPRTPRLRTIRELDFFNLAPDHDFDLVVGNPPWISRKDAPSVERWVFSEKDNGAAKGLNKSVRDQTLLPAKEVACGFMWKASLHAKPDGRVCQVLPSRVFLSNNTDRFQVHWLKRHRLESVWLLADYSFFLFPGADCPCFIGRYRPRADEEAFGDFEFISPKVESYDPREALIPVQPEDQKTISEQDIFDAAKREQAAFGWKKHHWGTPRDVKLVERLMRLPKLDELCARPPRMKRQDGGTRASVNKKRWWKGQGFQPLTEGDRPPEDEEGSEPWPIWWSKNHRYIAATKAASGYFLTGHEPYSNRPTEVRRTIPPELTRPPLVLINKACTKFMFSTVGVLFQDDFQSICAPKGQESELLFLTAVLSSPLTQYLLFHTTANIGIERDIARLEELLDLPFPLPFEMPDSKCAQSILDECADILRALGADLAKPENGLRQDDLVAQAKRRLNAQVYSYFGISSWERRLIEDTVQVFRPSSTPAKRDSDTLVTTKDSSPKHREQYAGELVKTFQGWTRSKENLWATTAVAPKSGLAMLTFGVGGRAKEYSETAADKRVEELLADLRTSSARDGGKVFQCMRSFAYYEGSKVHLLKPLSRRHWTRTAAQNDADSIIAHMLEEDGWSA